MRDKPIEKYKTEADFCENTTKIIAGLLIGTGKRVICVPEVPSGFFSNQQIDMLLLDIKNKKYLCIEYKLNDLQKLWYQIEKNKASNIPCIGILNTDTRNGYSGMFGYTGKDGQIEKLAEAIVYEKYQWRWHSIFTGLGMVYYWAYKNNKDNFRGGITSGNRIGFAAIYVRAIRNFHREYGRLDFLITHATLRSGYGVATGKKYYNQATLLRPIDD